MTVSRVDLVVPDPQPVFDWVEAHARAVLVRQVARETVLGWAVAVVFDDDAAAESLRAAWKDSVASPELVRRLAHAVIEERRAASTGPTPA